MEMTEETVNSNIDQQKIFKSVMKIAKHFPNPTSLDNLEHIKLGNSVHVKLYQDINFINLLQK